MNCLVCAMPLKLEEIQEAFRTGEDYDKVSRSCERCRTTYSLKYQGGRLLSITREGEGAHDNFGFIYHCPHCNHESRVYATYATPPTGWKCLNCGMIVPFEHLTSIGDYVVLPYTRIMSGGKSSKNRNRTSRTRTAGTGYQASPRASRPLPAGAIALATLAGEMKIEGKKLRGWLRKVNFRKAEEHGSGWQFSPEEAEGIKKNFGK